MMQRLLGKIIEKSKRTWLAKLKGKMHLDVRPQRELRRRACGAFDRRSPIASAGWAMAVVTQADDEQVAVWEAFAEHFLDTETRHEIPRTAQSFLCLGYSISKAHDIWFFEVSPALSINLLSVAGEWAGWDGKWLVERLAPRMNGKAGWLQRRLGPGLSLNRDVWVAIERCARFLLTLEDDKAREVATEDLGLLARHYFDFAPGKIAPQDRGRREALFRSTFRPIFSHLVAHAAGESERHCVERVEAALGL